MIYFKSVRDEKSVIGSRSLSHMFSIYASQEPSLNDAVQSSEKGIYLGRSARLSTPIFLDPTGAINPHIFVVGITGSGKSYLMKSMVLRMSLLTELEILVIDFTGEYGDLTNFMFCRKADQNNIEGLIGDRNSHLIYLDLTKTGQEEKKVEVATAVLKIVVSKMRKFGADGQSRMFVILDEAWKVLKSHSILETIIREGRKYGVGVVLASQILSDVEKDFLQNIGTIFVFRLQNSSSLSDLLSDYSLGKAEIEGIQNFELGRCLFIQLNKFKIRSCFVISRIEGVRLNKSVKISLSESVLEVDEKDFYSALERLQVNKNGVADIKFEVGKSSSIELCRLMKRLIGLGADRRLVLGALRGFGLDDSDIADAFSAAVD